MKSMYASSNRFKTSLRSAMSITCFMLRSSVVGTEPRYLIQGIVSTTSPGSLYNESSMLTAYRLPCYFAVKLQLE